MKAHACQLLTDVAAVIARSALNHEGNTALLIACHAGHVECATALLAASATHSIGNKVGSTPLLVAAYGGHVACVEALLRSGASATHSDSKGRTPLHASCHKGRIEVARLLLPAMGTSADQPDEVGATPLLVACYAGQAAVVELLLSESHGYASAPVWRDRRAELQRAAMRTARRPVRRCYCAHRLDAEAEWQPAVSWSKPMA